MFLLLQYVSVRVSPGQMMIFGGTDDPCGMVELESLGSVGGAKNKRLIAAIGHHIQEALGIPQDRSEFSPLTLHPHHPSCFTKF